MSKFVEVRVRPVTRFVVTRYESGHVPVGGNYGQCETIGEFDSERYAEQVADALRAASAPAVDEAPVEGNNRFIVIREGDFTPETVAYYAQDENEADETAARLERETGRGWRIARRL